MLSTTHPGIILKEEIEARQMSAHALALAIRVPASRIGEIIAGRRAVSADTALRLGRYLGTGPELWMNLQSAYDLGEATRRHGARIEQEVTAA